MNERLSWNHLMVMRTLLYLRVEYMKNGSIDLPQFNRLISTANRNMCNFKRITIHHVCPLKELRVGLYSFVNLMEFDVDGRNEWRVLIDRE